MTFAEWDAKQPFPHRMTTAEHVGGRKAAWDAATAEATRVERERLLPICKGLLKMCRELAEEAKTFCPDREHEEFHADQLRELGEIAAAIRRQP